MKIIAVITALNEQETIGGLVDAALKYCDNVIVVNDGSTDETGGTAFIAGATVIGHPERQGIAASLMQAWELAYEMGANRVVQIDAGGSHDPEQIHQLLHPGADVVIGSRFCEGAKYIGGNRQHFSRFYASLCNWAIGGFVASDWTSGYRVFGRHAIETLLQEPPYWTNGHAWQAEIIHRAIRRALSVVEVPITYTAGRSTMKLSHVYDAFLVLNKVMNL